MKKLFSLISCIIYIFNSLVYAAPPTFVMHTIKEPTVFSEYNSVPNMVIVHDVDRDGFADLIASHVSWTEKFIHPFVAWYKGPDFTREYIIIDKSVTGENSRIYRFVLFDIDKDGRNDLIGQGYQPYHNGNKWYRSPEDPTQLWTEYYDYGTDLDNGHDLMLWDINGDQNMDLVLLDSHHGKVIVKSIPFDAEAAKKPWKSHVIASNIGFTHYMSRFDVNRDGYDDIVVGKEEDGGKGIWWLENPGENRPTVRWRKHFVFDANFTKVFARDIDHDGDVDFIGTGEYFTGIEKEGWMGKGFMKLTQILMGRSRNLPSEEAFYFFLARIKRSFGYSHNALFMNKDVGWLEKGDVNYLFHEFDKEDNENDIIGGHNCELVDVDGDGDEDLITGGVDVHDMKQRFRWYEYIRDSNSVRWIEHPLGVTSASGWVPRHGYYCGEMTWGDIDNDGDRDLFYAGVGSGFLGWFENKTN